MAVTNTLGYYDTATITTIKGFIVDVQICPGACTIKFFHAS
jgi:hypothetical protein